MSAHHLPVYVGNALNENLEWLPSLKAGKVGRKRILSFCRNLRIAGIGELLMTGLPEEFQLRLHQSGRAYAAWLRTAEEGERRTGQSAPFFDAIAVGDLDGATRIAHLSNHTWTQGVEYEEDFLFVEFLMQRFFLDAPGETCESLLRRYETALRGAEDVRLELCGALQAADAEGFDRALRRFLAEYRDHFEELARQGGASPVWLATEGKVCVEGVALVRLAQGLGLETEEDYLLVPSVAREKVARVFTEDSWMEP
ncbi:immunity 49 family protein [Pyxidicoccus fallax]|uniref:Immunity 49 family protein n=1 Tax=Pyxidicoccus fallax TaxID=394095 RepID=A0A848L698_9BACT|nr:Imm49 family immunity protein [Pyxidicoccus fallax]NMO13802.1 immunity 49 family protein [Pyxidicoccus fallax]NPC77011.1 immunity 49 family protein [Pyxidicoccus fallax]